MENQKDINYYLELPYTFQVKRVEDEGNVYYWASVKELDGCHTSGVTWEEAYTELLTVFRTHLEIKLEYGDPIPEPGQEEYSGKFNLRVPKSLHRELAIRAAEENVSLNQYCLFRLSSVSSILENEMFKLEGKVLYVNFTSFFDHLKMGDKWLLQTLINLATDVITNGGKMLFIRLYSDDFGPEIKAVYNDLQSLNDFVKRVKTNKLA